MKTILVPTDYSQDSRESLLFALEIARIAEATIILFHAFHQPLPVDKAFKVEELIAQLEKEKNQVLTEFAAEVKLDSCKNFTLEFISTQHAGAGEAGTLTKSQKHVLAIDEAVAGKAAVNITCISKFGLAADEILAAIKTYQPGLVVMSMRGAGAVSQAFMGSTVAMVISEATVPVLALPSKLHPRAIKSIVFATDLRHLAGNQQLSALRYLVKIFGASLQVLHLYQHNNPAQEQEIALPVLEALDTQLYDLDYEVHFRRHADTVVGIQEFLQEQHADLVVLIPAHHSFLEKLCQKTITGKFTHQANLPMLTLPSQTNSLPTETSEKEIEEKS